MILYNIGYIQSRKFLKVLSIINCIRYGMLSDVTQPLACSFTYVNLIILSILSEINSSRNFSLIKSCFSEFYVNLPTNYF